MPKRKSIVDFSQKELQSLKKNELIRLVIDLHNSTNSQPSDSLDSLPGFPARRTSPQESTSDGIRCPSNSFRDESSSLVAQIKSAVTDAVRDLKSELRLEYQSALAEQEHRFSKEVIALREEIVCLKNKIEQTGQDLEAEFLRDLRDAELRKKNLILFGVNESVSSTPSERKEADFRAVKMLASELGVNDLHFQNAFRLGKLRDKSRPIKLTGLSYQQREDLLRCCYHIPKLNPALGFCKVFIKADLSLKEQAVHRELRRKVDARRDAGERVFLRDGKIVLRTENSIASTGTLQSLNGERQED